MQMCPPLIIWEIKIKTTIIYHFTPTKMEVKKKKKRKADQCVYLLELSYCRWECKLDIIILENRWRFPIKLNIDLPGHPADVGELGTPVYTLQNSSNCTLRLCAFYCI